MTRPARLGPGTRQEIGLPATLFARVAGRVSGTEPPAIFTTLARHRRLFWRWLWFAGSLMPRGRLPRADTELVILRVAHLCDCDYEREHHERLARRAGLDHASIARVAEGPQAAGWTPRAALLMRATDELHAERRLADGTWDELGGVYDERQLIELCMLVGHYEMLAMTLNSLGVPPDRKRRDH